MLKQTRLIRINNTQSRSLVSTNKQQSLIPEQTRQTLQSRMEVESSGRPSQTTRHSGDMAEGGESIVAKMVGYGILASLVGTLGYYSWKPVPFDDQRSKSSHDYPTTASSSSAALRSSVEPPMIANASQYMAPLKRLQYRLLSVYKRYVDSPEFMYPFLPAPITIPIPMPPGTPQSLQKYYRVPTLIIEPEGTLFQTEWTRDKGWHVIKRPYAEYFLSYLSQYYEIVIWSSRTLNQGGQSLQEMALHQLDIKSGGAISQASANPQDPNANRLYRDHLAFDLDGGRLNMVKDLNNLGRDLSTTILLDQFKDEVINADDILIVPSLWDTQSPSKDKDAYLLDMLPFLETLAMSKSNDFRPILKQYQGTDIPKEFAKNVEMVRQKTAQEQAARLQSRESIANIGQSGGGGGILGTLMAFLGIKPISQPMPGQVTGASMPTSQQQSLSQADAMLQHHNEFAKNLEKSRQEQEQVMKQAEQQQQEFMEKSQNIRITLWDLIVKGQDAVLEGMDPETRKLVEQMNAQNA
ncbi:hypothetical protein MP228_012534 [Amoeboaphelidium protococcarum]|nr:hypothetical protein MP228_012534 [Amoeboaphelidium protococcarum]